MCGQVGIFDHLFDIVWHFWVWSVSKGVMAPLYSRRVAWFTTNPSVISSSYKKGGHNLNLCFLVSFCWNRTIFIYQYISNLSWCCWVTRDRVREATASISSSKVAQNQTILFAFPEAQFWANVVEWEGEGQSPSWTLVTNLLSHSLTLPRSIAVI